VKTRRAFLAWSEPAAKPKLDFRTLGKTGLKVTTVGFGCMITSDGSVVERAADLGINYFDTARVYQGGNNERMVGAALKSRRSQICLSSKSKARQKEAALADLDASLREISTDHLDIWYLHDVKKPEEITDGALEAQNLAREQGKIRFRGISTHSNQAAVIRAALSKNHFDVVLTSYNFAMDQGLEPALAEAKKAGVGLVAMKVMAGGFRVMPFYPTTPEHRERMKKPGACVAALKWVLKNKDIDTTVPSMVDQDQLDENLTAMSAPYTPAEERMLAAQLDRIRPLYCQMCGQCDGQCPRGLPVAEVLRSLMYADGYRQFALGREHYLELGVEGRCRECPGCQIECPYGVNVARRVRRAQELFA
jgi:predicted aldo/keto reductase-like oxidoreductase